MNKPKEILELEKIFGITLRETVLSEDIMKYDNRNFYQLNDKNEIVGINLSSNQISEIKGLENLTQLKQLNLSFNQISEIKGLEKLSHLQLLDFRKNQVSEIKGLEKLSHLQKLCFYENQISEIKGLEQLTQLQQLDLYYNRIKEIKGLEKLTQLQKLWLSGNQISEINGLEKLSHLQELFLTNNLIGTIEPLRDILELSMKLEKLRIYGNAFSNPQLEKTGNNLDDIRKYFSDIKRTPKEVTLTLDNKPKEILELEKLYGIELEGIAFGNDIMTYENRNCYQYNDKNEIVGLNLFSNQINEIKGLEKLTYLQQLYLRNNQIREIKGLEKLTQLRELDLCQNQISGIKGLEKLTQLQKLDFRYNQISKIKGLEKLTQLQKLDFRNNQISEIKGLEKLTQLQELNFRNNQISEIKGLEKLSNLQEIDLCQNNISEIKELEKLTYLQQLLLGSNPIREIKGLEKLSNLRNINFRYNQISEVKGLEKLTQLQQIDLSRNQISEIKGLEKLTQLQKLDLSDNQLTKVKKLKKTLRQKDFTILQIDNNPFLQQESLMLESGKNHKDDILKYLSDIDEQQKKIKITLPVKIMFLGNHGAGKSTFLDYLQDGKLPQKKESTHILEVHSYPANQQNNKSLPQAMIYDFGGQDYYHGVYRAFFSENSITLLFWCNSSNKNDEREAQNDKDCDTCDFTWNYWLFQLDEAINRLKKDEIKEPLLLVQTHRDMPNNEECIYSDILNKLVNFEIKGKHFITLRKEAAEKEIIQTERLNNLKKELVNIVQEKTIPQTKPAYYEEFLQYVLNFKGEEYVRVKEDILDKGHYKREPINNETNDDLLTYLKADLNQLYLKGLVLYYRDSSINNIVWLNSSKTIEYIYKYILPKDIITEYQGKIPEATFNNLWKKSNTQKAIFEKIEELLVNEKIVFFDKIEKRYIIPSFLPLSSEDQLYKKLSREFKEQVPSFILKFRNFIPFGLINELICLYGKLPEDKDYWRNQLIFWFDSEHNVWIKFNFPQLSIEVYIREKNERSELALKEVKRAIFLNIMDLYQGNYLGQMIDDEEMSNFSKRIKQYIQAKDKQKIKYPKDMYISVSDGIYVKPTDFDKNKNIIPAYELIDSDERTRNGEIIEILGIEATTTSEIKLYKDFNDKSVIRMKKIFISYSRKDVKYKDELRNHLNMLKIFDIADNWSCEDINVEEWHDKIQKELQESDLIIYMLSANFFSSNYILENEVKKGLKQVSEDKNKKLLCVIVSDFVGLDNLKKFLKDSAISDTLEAITKLSDWQYLPYGKTENKTTNSSEEKIIPLERYPHINEAYAQITEKILKSLS